MPKWHFMDVWTNYTVTVNNGATETFTYEKTLNPTQLNLAQHNQGYTRCHFRISHNDTQQDLCFDQPFDGKFNYSTVTYQRVITDNLVSYLNFSVRATVVSNQLIKIDVNANYFDGRNVASQVVYTFCFDYIEFFY